MRLGVFGGTFDPIHVGHLKIAVGVRVQLGLDEVLFVPAGQPSLKSDRQVTDARHRLAMTSLAVATDPLSNVSDMEIKRPGPSYSVDTLEELARTRGCRELYLIVGIDALAEVDRWHQPARILDLATIVAVHRHGAESLHDLPMEALGAMASEKVMVARTPRVDVSSTKIRDRVGQGLPINDLVPGPVQEYIAKHGLYQGPGEQRGAE